MTPAEVLKRESRERKNARARELYRAKREAAGHAPRTQRAFNCVVCGQPFTAVTAGESIYCSSTCGVRAFRKRQPPKALKPCPVCTRPFQPSEHRHTYCTPACARTAELDRLRARNSGAGKNWSKGKELAPRRQCELCGTSFYAPPVLIKRGGGRFCGNDCRTRHFAMNPAGYPQTSTRRSRPGKRADIGIFVRSSWEANYARYLNWLIAHGQIVGWSYEPETFEFKTIKRGSRFYTPDFKVEVTQGTFEFHEVKGYMDDRSATKLKRMAKFYPQHKVVLIDSTAYRAIEARVSGLIQNWERPQS